MAAARAAERPEAQKGSEDRQECKEERKGRGCLSGLRVFAVILVFLCSQGIQGSPGDQKGNARIPCGKGHPGGSTHCGTTTQRILWSFLAFIHITFDFFALILSPTLAASSTSLLVLSSMSTYLDDNKAMSSAKSRQILYFILICCALISSHPSHVKNFIPCSQFLRLRSLCSEGSDFSLKSDEMNDFLPNFLPDFHAQQIHRQ